MKMTPQELEDSLVDYLYDELDKSERARFEAALPESPEIAAEIAAHRRTLEAMDALEDMPVPAGLLDGILAEAERRAEARIESEPSFLERLIAGLLQPASLTLGLFFVVATTGYFMVERQGNPETADTSVAVKAAPAVPAAKVGEVLKTEVPELAEGVKEEQEEDADEGAAPTMGRQADANQERKDAPNEQGMVEQLLAQDDVKSGAPNERVVGGTVARLVNMDSAPDVAKADSVGELDGSAPRQRATGGKKRRVARSMSKEQPKRKMKGYEKQAKLAAKAIPEGADRASGARSQPGLGKRSVQSARGGMEEVARERDSINVARAPLSKQSSSHTDKEASSEKSRYALASDEIAPPPESAPARAPVPAQASTASRQRASTADPEEAEPPATAPVKEASRSAWQQVEQEAANQKNARSKAGVWLGAYERFMKRGRHDLASRALDKLGKVPGYESVAKEKRRRLSKSKAAAKSKKNVKKAPTKSKSRK